MKKSRFLPFALSLAIGLSYSAIAMAATAPSVASDTTNPITLKLNDSYTVKFTVHGTHADPKIAAGNGRVLQTQAVKKLKDSDGNDVYLFKVKAIGAVGEQSSIYTTLPGQFPEKEFTVTVESSGDSERSDGHITEVDTPAIVARGLKALFSIQGNPNTAYTLTIQDQSGSAKTTTIGTVTSGNDGIAKWTWTVGSGTALGTHQMTVTGGGQTYQTSYEVVDD
ncbi:hypothetical protein [Caproicibacter sp.]|uniref:hypothetical protein n=1 Tax=Caproicibacter sp. TaxID=2814884 RepID=UPI0039892039